MGGSSIKIKSLLSELLVIFNLFGIAVTASAYDLPESSYAVKNAFDGTSLVEHVFAGFVQMVGGTFIRCKSLIRARFNISLLNLIYNIRRVAFLERVTMG